ncbi:adenine DNA glycosylase-like [Mytilus californianus]|uniref:adenine DNA glycosylase-like n=1 Tax=Mytilus californianus TaxID=6549 RepID=UPI002245CD27|nr:adenine DNA glycosylase-like [Mytilus californianus]
MVKRKINQNGTSGTESIHDFSSQEVKEFRELLVKWYSENKRDLPWRRQITNPDVNQRAYAVWVSEVMLQQTQVATVISYYNKWMQKWPTLQDLSKASLEEVNEAWSGLGYYSRGRRLHEGAQKVVNEMKGKMPKTADELLKQLPGVGKYTAGAIASIAYGQATGIVDGNVIRVLCRMRKMGGDSTSQPVQDKLWQHANSLVDPDKAGDFNQGMMELGATICTPKTPSCNTCPVRSLCLANKEVEFDKQEKTKELTKDRTKPIITDIECCVDSCPLCIQSNEVWDSSLGVQNYPRKGKKKAAREEQTKVCILCKKNKSEALYCIVQRPQKGLLAGLWEFPSVKIDKDHPKEASPQQLLVDSCGLHVDTVASTCHVGEVVHLFSHIHQTYIIDSLTVEEDGSDTVVKDPSSTRPLRWVTEEELQESAVSTAMKKVFKAYTEKMNSKTPAKTKKQKVDKKQPAINSFSKSKS